MRMARLELARAMPTRTSSVRVYQFRHIRTVWFQHRLYHSMKELIKNNYFPNFCKYFLNRYETDRNIVTAQVILEGLAKMPHNEELRIDQKYQICMAVKTTFIVGVKQKLNPYPTVDLSAKIQFLAAGNKVFW